MSANAAHVLMSNSRTSCASLCEPLSRNEPSPTLFARRRYLTPMHNARFTGRLICAAADQPSNSADMVLAPNKANAASFQLLQHQTRMCGGRGDSDERSSSPTASRQQRWGQMLRETMSSPHILYTLA